VARPIVFLMNGIQAADPWAIAVTASLFLCTGLAASYTSSVRATCADPLVVLRSE
jgi:ABC-type lipoprotein release transport system permease subunit